jgi:hypothetical protein
MKARTSNVRWLVEITLWDHCSTTGGLSDPIPCKAWGILAAHDKLAYYLVHWAAGGEIDDNADSHTILKSTVIALKKIAKVRL